MGTRSAVAAKQAAAAPPSEPAAEWVPIGELAPWADNPRVNDHAVPDVVDSIERFGFGAPLLARRANKELIAGHTRIKAALKLGLTHLPVRYLDLSAREAHLLALADNRLGEKADWSDGLYALLKEYEQEEVALAGWSESDFAQLAKDALNAAGTGDGEVTEDEAPEPPKNPVTKLGDVWTLGRHMLVCGDSTSRDSWSKLPKVDAVFTSPPYALGQNAGLRLKSAAGPARTAYDVHQDGPAEWPELMRGFAARAFEAASCVVVNVQALAGNKRSLFSWVNEHGERLCDVVVWNKGTAQPAMHAGVLDSMFEFVWIFGEPGASRCVPFSTFRGTLRNVYEAPAARAADKVTEAHGAVFPVHLPSFVMRDLCTRAKTWLDPFCGTGTSISAAEQLERTCHGIELSPAYCDVIVERWQTLSGQKATRVPA